jgi:hypothetical protein
MMWGETATLGGSWVNDRPMITGPLAADGGLE